MKLSPCIEWAGYKTPEGYGEFRVEGVKWKAHRYAFFKANGVIPEGLVIRHRCDNRGCVNVEHLELGTTQDNTADRVERGRSATGTTNGNSKLDKEKVLSIRASGLPQRVLAEQYGVSQGVISQIMTRKTWRDI